MYNATGKLSTFYKAYLNEKTKDMRTFQNGSSSAQMLKEFLENKFNAKDFSEAEELLNATISEAEENGFAAGAKYIFELGLELTGKNE